MRLEYLEDGSPDCPLIRIYGCDQGAMVTLHEAICDLAAGTTSKVEVVKLPGLRAVRGCTLALIPASRFRPEGIRQRSDTLDFEWALPIPTWEIVAGLIEPFLKRSEHRHHQWLYGEEAIPPLNHGEVAVLLSEHEDGRW
jgi:hypothetical protein